jgi:hypothetical protein
MLVAGGNPSVGPTRYGAASRALRGTPSIVTYGNRRSWPLAWDYKFHADPDVRLLQRVEAVYRGWVARRAYLLDTRQVNALQPDVASCGAELGIENFNATSGVLTRVNEPAIHADLYGQCDGYLTWTGPTAGAGQQMGCNPMLPVVDGSSYLFSAYVNTDGSGASALTLKFYDPDRTSLSDVQGTAITLPATPTRYSLLVPASSVPDGAATFQCGFTTTATTTDLSTVGWQVEYDSASSTPADWFMGAGGSEVVVDTFNIIYPDAFGRQISATFLEV